MWWSALILGFVSSLHCMGMCAPLQAVAMGAAGSNTHKSNILTYHTSRILTYGFLGIIAAIAGKGLGLENWQQQASLLSGLLLLFAFAAFYFLKLDRQLLKVIYPLISRIRTNLQKNKSSKVLYFGGSGMINGLLPCGMVYLAIFPAMGSGSLFSAFTYMLLFGAGTLPLLVLTNFGAISFFQGKAGLVQKAIPVMVVVTATLLILRGMDLGIPYLSPQQPIAGASTEVCQ